MAFNAQAIANYFIELSVSKGVALSSMKIQKLVYFAHGWHLAIKNGEPLIDEQVEAWAFGPVIPSLYASLKYYGNLAVTTPIVDRTRFEPTNGDFKFHVPTIFEKPGEVEFTRTLLNRIWEIYSPYTAIQLSNLTHEPDTPWSQVFNEYTRDGGTIPKGTDIPRDAIRAYFKNRLRPAAKTG